MRGSTAAWPWLRVAGTAAGLLVVALAVRALLRNWTATTATAIPWRISPGWLVLGLVLILACFALLVEAWRRLLMAMGHRLAFRDAARIWTVSSLAKYVPGKVWALAGAVALARGVGIPAAVALRSTIVMQLLGLATGVAVVALGSSPVELTETTRHVINGLAIVSVASIALLVWPAAVRRVDCYLPDGWRLHQPLAPGPLLLAAAACAVSWIGYGAAFAALARGSLAAVTMPLASATAVFTAAYLAGLVTVFAPGGAGVREGALVLILTPVTGARAALALSLASRVVFTLAELLAAGPFLLSARRHRGVQHEVPGD